MLADAQTHPQFAYKPETGEEIYHSLLGVPILRDNRVIGVLVVQNQTRRQYAEEEVEALETIAMVLAEMVASGQLSGGEELAAVSRTATMPFRADGRLLSEGLAIGVAVLHEPRIHVEKTIADDIPFEKQRLDAAVTSMRDQVNRMLEAPDSDIVGESRDVLKPTRCSPMTPAGWPSCTKRWNRPDGRGRRAARAGRHAPSHAGDHRSLPARTAG